MQSSRSHASLSPKDWINVDELTLEKQFNLLKKKKDDIARYQNPSNNQFNRIKKDLLSSMDN